MSHNHDSKRISPPRAQQLSGLNKMGFPFAFRFKGVSNSENHLLPGGKAKRMSHSILIDDGFEDAQVNSVRNPFRTESTVKTLLYSIRKPAGWGNECHPITVPDEERLPSSPLSIWRIHRQSPLPHLRAVSAASRHVLPAFVTMAAITCQWPHVVQRPYQRNVLRQIFYH
jgi:hypothetical protein